MKKVLLLVCALCAISFASCTEEDNGVTVQEVKKAQYNREFEKAFGKVPAGQSWDFQAQAMANGNNMKEGVRLFCEDLDEIGGFDFNDLVVDLKKVNGKPHATIQAVGGTLPIYLYINNSTTPLGGGELHEVMGQTKKANGLYAPINVGGSQGVSATPMSFEIAASVNGDLNSSTVKAVITGLDGAQHEINYSDAATGQAPEIFSVPIDTRWMKEDQNIKSGYGSFFTGDWYNNPTDESKLY